MNPHLFFDLTKGLYDQAKRKVQTARAIKQTEDAISSEAPAEKKPRFTMAHLHAAKEKFKEKHGVAADTSRKSTVPEWLEKGLLSSIASKIGGKKPSTFSEHRAASQEHRIAQEKHPTGSKQAEKHALAAQYHAKQADAIHNHFAYKAAGKDHDPKLAAKYDGSKLGHDGKHIPRKPLKVSPKGSAEAQAARHGLDKSILGDVIAKSGPVGDAVTASKLAHSSSAAAHAGQGGHDVAAKAHRDAANKHWRVMNRVSSDTPKHEKHRQLMKQHYDIAESHDKLVTKGLAIPEWFSKAQR